MRPGSLIGTVTPGKSSRTTEALLLAYASQTGASHARLDDTIHHPDTHVQTAAVSDSMANSKHLIKRINREHPTSTRRVVLSRASAQYNQAKRIYGYSPYYSTYGTEPNIRRGTSLLTDTNTHEPTDQKKKSRLRGRPGPPLRCPQSGLYKRRRQEGQNHGYPRQAARTQGNDSCVRQ